MSDPIPVTEMFDDISQNYDFLNHFLSFGIDRYWRRKTSKLLARYHPEKILDVATGTADLAIRMAKDHPNAQITGVDLSEKMLSIGQQKINGKSYAQRIRLVVADAAALPFEDNSFDIVTVAFGVRNFSHREKGLEELFRVCRDGGLVAILEFSHPNNALVKRPYRWYSRGWIPKVGQKISKHPDAYQYLTSSIEAFPSAEAFMETLSQIGLQDLHAQPFNGGIATLYYGKALKNRESAQ